MQVSEFLRMAGPVASALQIRTWIIQALEFAVYILLQLVFSMTLQGDFARQAVALGLMVVTAMIITRTGRKDHRAQAQNLMLSDLPTDERERLVAELRRLGAFVD